MGSFDTFLTLQNVPAGKKDALIAVADTMFMGQMWFKDNGFEPSADHLLKFAEIVLRYEIDKERLAMEPFE